MLGQNRLLTNRPNTPGTISAYIFSAGFNFEDRNSELSNYIESHHIPEDCNLSINVRTSYLVQSVSDKERSYRL
jgi:hypothetical protein